MCGLPGEVVKLEMFHTDPWKHGAPFCSWPMQLLPKCLPSPRRFHPERVFVHGYRPWLGDGCGYRSGARHDAIVNCLTLPVPRGGRIRLITLSYVRHAGTFSSVAAVQCPFLIRPPASITATRQTVLLPPPSI